MEKNTLNTKSSHRHQPSISKSIKIQKNKTKSKKRHNLSFAFDILFFEIKKGDYQMIRFLLESAAILAIGYGVKKFFEDDENIEKIDDALCTIGDRLEELEQNVNKFLDTLGEKAEAYFGEGG
jgi:hypothetical protein